MSELMLAFGDQRNMKLFFAANHTKKNGGIQYLVTRCFRKTECITGSVGKEVATVAEAKLHFHSAVQYLSLGEKERRRHALITEMLAKATLKDSLFQATRQLTFKEMNRYYGRSNQHTIWNALPIPQVKNIDGIAYMNPVDLILFQVAFGIELDEFTIDFASEKRDDNSTAVTREDKVVVTTIPESKACREWKDELLRNNSEDTPRGVMVADSDWEDAFGSNRTKRMRKSTNAWTNTAGTPSSRANSIDNTLPIAIGLKKNRSWWKVKLQFKKDMERLQNGSKPLMAYHGKMRKVIPIYVRRVACMCDKVEKAEYTCTLSCTSILHRCFGSIIAFEPPTLNVEPLLVLLSKQKNGEDDLNLRRYAWSNVFVDTAKNSGFLPSCSACRQKNVAYIRSVNSNNQDEQLAVEACEHCADWVLDETTSEKLPFAPPSKYPQDSLPNCPVDPPPGREPGLDILKWMPLTFPTLIQSARFAYFNSHERRGKGWTKEKCKAYLRTCGVNGRQQDLLYDAARADYTDGIEVDYTSERLGTYQLPAAWVGELELSRCIEMLMHLLFLGVAESNFKLCNKYIKSGTGRGEETFKRNMHCLLKDLTGFNLSWLLALPFSGSKQTKHTTGTWVSENWLAWVRLSKVVYVWTCRNEADERNGANDVIRMVTSFYALVAHCLSHAGATDKTVDLVRCHVKEFLSSVRELDLRTRHHDIQRGANRNAGGQEERARAVGDDKNTEQWWLKSNYISLLNLAPTIAILGPLINFWDGGGRGERYIQEIKPHIPRGVRDGGLFFVYLLQKILKLKSLRLIEDDVAEEDEGSSNDESSTSSSSCSDDNSARISGEEVGNDLGSENSGSSRIIEATVPTTINIGGTVSDDEETIGENEREEEQQWVTPMEAAQMSKARTFYIYKSRDVVEEAIANRKPVAAIVVKSASNSAETFAVYKCGGKSYGWLKLEFDDEQGTMKCGMHYAAMQLNEVAKSPPRTFKRLQKMAQMSAMAIPLRYALGNDDQDAAKYCVITNWWRERNRTGNYVFPSLDFERYEAAAASI